MPHLLAAPDKYRGTAGAAAIAASAGRAAAAAGWTVSEVPLSDGGEGLLDAVGGARRYSRVTGPLGAPVDAQWRFVPAGPGSPPTAVIEMAQAAGLALVDSLGARQPLVASTYGVGQLVLEGVAAGAQRIVVGCGGSATTDGGWGAVQAIGSPERLGGIDLIAACDVTTPFLEAASVFGPQKGATPEQVVQLTGRLDALSTRYRTDFGVEVALVPGAGAAGGLAGGLVALGGRTTSGFDLVASLVGLSEEIDRADLVVTGEGRLDHSSFEGKVVGGVLELAQGRSPVLCIVGECDPTVDREHLGARNPREGPTGGWAPPALVVLAEQVGPTAARDRVLALVEETVAAHLRH